MAAAANVHQVPTPARTGTGIGPRGSPPAKRLNLGAVDMDDDVDPTQQVAQNEPGMSSVACVQGAETITTPLSPLQPSQEVIRDLGTKCLGYIQQLLQQTSDAWQRTGEKNNEMIIQAIGATIEQTDHKVGLIGGIVDDHADRLDDHKKRMQDTHDISQQLKAEIAQLRQRPAHQEQPPERVQAPAPPMPSRQAVAAPTEIEITVGNLGWDTPAATLEQRAREVFVKIGVGQSIIGIMTPRQTGSIAHALLDSSKGVSLLRLKALASGSKTSYMDSETGMGGH